MSDDDAPLNAPDSSISPARLRGRTIAILESRAGEQLARVIERHGGRALAAPALSELPEIDEGRIAELVARWLARPPCAFVFQTGVGARAMFEAVERVALTRDLLHVLDQAKVFVRGPKPTAALRARHVRIDHHAAEPFTTNEVLRSIDGSGVPIAGQEVAVQRYGESNAALDEALASRGAHVTEVGTYRWSVPQDRAPLLALIDALERKAVDAVTFTSGVQASNLFAVASDAGRTEALRQGLGGTVVASVGPACSATLQKLGVRVDFEASPPKLGPLVAGLCDAFEGAPPRA
ncbi:MAG: uroporphyrinogen-III synthase [Pseudomonadota bacterium]|nr:uroporphyrinogen-III synthase [Pseudomonadota bacterium]